MFFNILKGGNDENLSDDEEEHNANQNATANIKDDHYKALTSEKGNKLRSKIKFVGKIAKLQKTLRFDKFCKVFFNKAFG